MRIFLSPGYFSLLPSSLADYWVKQPQFLRLERARASNPSMAKKYGSNMMGVVFGDKQERIARLLKDIGERIDPGGQH